jgi:hypothetical protein
MLAASIHIPLFQKNPGQYENIQGTYILYPDNNSTDHCLLNIKKQSGLTGKRLFTDG